MDIKGVLNSLCTGVMRHFESRRSILTFSEFLQLMTDDPVLYCRSAAEYLKDVMDFYGRTTVVRPHGTYTRFNLFDVPFDKGMDKLIGQEEVQEAFYRVISNSVKEGKVKKLILLHGPNGSAKSTFVDCVMRAMADYSRRPEGALYRITWIFPSRSSSRKGIGFTGIPDVKDLDSFAHIPEEEMDAKLPCELYDHPILLVPPGDRPGMFGDFGVERGAIGSDYILHGNLCHKCRRIFDALMIAYRGDLAQVLRHVQVERFYISQRYRRGAVTIAPQLHVDARARQVTVDRSFSALPVVLQNETLFEPFGELVDSNRGIIEYSDLLKRPIETFKYLLSTCEDGTINLENLTIYVDTVFVGSTNEVQLAAFKETSDFISFKGRIELVRMPYLRDVDQEEEIYQAQTQGVAKHVAPHVTSTVALWALLTRMIRPEAERFPPELKTLLRHLTPLQKVKLYSRGEVPDKLKRDEARLLRSSIKDIYRETAMQPTYEGIIGASPRELKTLIMNASQDPEFPCLSPLAILKSLRFFVKEKSLYPFLRIEAEQGYSEYNDFVDQVKEDYLNIVDGEVRISVGLIEETAYDELFEKYMLHVTHWVRKEKIFNKVTGRYEDADKDLMEGVERIIRGEEGIQKFRESLISTVGAYSLDHPKEGMDYNVIFPDFLRRLKAEYFKRNKEVMVRAKQNLLVYLTDGPSALSLDDAEQARSVLDKLKTRFGYCDSCAKEAVSFLLKERYSS